MPGDAWKPAVWEPVPDSPPKPTPGGAGLWIGIGAVVAFAVLLVFVESPLALLDAIPETGSGSNPGSDRGCPKAGTGVHGQVLDHRGAPLDGATITVRSYSTDRSTWTGRSGDDGCFAISTRTGRWQVCAEDAPNYLGECANASVNPGDSTRVDFRMSN